MDIRVPHLAEGISSGTVVSILVAEGDQVTKDQTVMELETEKAVAPIPSPSAGVVQKVLVGEGDAVAVGHPVISLSGESSDSDDTVGPAPAPGATTAAPSVSKEPAPTTQAQTYQAPAGFPPPASPSVRKMARELGIDLARVRGTESGGRISMADVRDYIQALQQGAFVAQPTVSAVAEKKVASPIDFSKFGPVSRKPMSTLRKKISEKMSESWDAVVHVTQFDEADISALVALRKKHIKDYEQAGSRLTLTGLIVKGVIEVLKRHPIFNASIDEASQEVVLKEYFNLGLAVDTEQGLIVPVIRDVDKKNILELSNDIQELAQKTRDRKVGIEDLQGGSFTISNQGGIGGAHFTPIVNKPEVAILGLGQSKSKAIVKNNKVVVGSMIPLCLSYDHRLIDGGSAARFIADLVATLEDFDEGLVKLDGKSKKSSSGKKKGK